jgi:hypothetical protein
MTVWGSIAPCAERGIPLMRRYHGRLPNVSAELDSHGLDAGDRLALAVIGIWLAKYPDALVSEDARRAAIRAGAGTGSGRHRCSPRWQFSPPG